MLFSYGEIVGVIGKFKVLCVVGIVIGSNLVVYFIFCYWVIWGSGMIGNYMWGESWKMVIIGWEVV